MNMHTHDRVDYRSMTSMVSITYTIPQDNPNECIDPSEGLITDTTCMTDYQSLSEHDWKYASWKNVSSQQLTC